MGEWSLRRLSVTSTLTYMFPRGCQEDGCSRGHLARGWCGYHYSRWYRYGDPQADGRAMREFPLSDPVDRFWSHVTIGEDHECWEWTTLAGTGKYVTFRLGSKRDGTSRNVRGHRYSYELAHGPIPPGLSVLHRCDNPPCVNPAHLWTGTLADNNRDRQQKGRTVVPDNRGELSGNALLTASEVLEIRRLNTEGVTQREIGRRFNVAQTTVSAIVLRRSWAHLPEESS